MLDKTILSSPVFLDLCTYVPQMTFGKNCVAHYLAHIGYALIPINKHTLF